MVAFELDGVEIDRCLLCRGTWLDAGEIEAIAERAGVPRGRLRRGLGGAPAERRTRRSCPRCPRTLRQFLAGEVVLDRCPNHCGLWLDPGELSAVVRSFVEGEEGAVARFLVDLYHEDWSAAEKGGT
jgi:Zn-finger nucleic acid-binding protein